MTDRETAPPPQSARDKLLAAGFAVIRSKGYSGTSVDELCAAAGVTKGAFFHHFKSKEALGVAAAEYWSEFTSELFAAAPYHDHADPLDRVLGYIDFRRQLLAGELPDYTCLVGTMVQETYLTAPAIRDACHASIAGHAHTLAPDIQAAMDARGMSDAGWTAESLALHTQAVLQGAFILAKAEDSMSVAIDSVAHLKRYVTLLFNQPEEKAA
ncbi:TetR/AcrR family transcriptional regulator [Hoeflea sp. J2-29]|uniref:TetR/AcrR family transcriptional regulator n=2 Tax=Hoeflea ulvae TaxID=2983764 RepID=A0ABT3YF80_9HYPH|nr:TetR/AcrR family transcriptional regulator [Hoeflea ulvae]MCY0094552.1 TetR/AcrR family transcriptional regulator [Hoeflea ulvae]